MKLYGYYLSLASFRVRIAMALKGLEREDVSLDLLKGDQFDTAFQKVNPQMVVPALIDDDGHVITQSIAILEYLDETYRDPPLLPDDSLGRARVRQIAQIAIADSHPLIVPRVRSYLTKQLNHSEAEMTAWVRHWLTVANEAIEALLAAGPRGTYAHGDQVTLADLCIVPQVAGSRRFECDLSGQTHMTRVFDACMALDGFQAALPKNQPDFVPS